MGGENRLWGEGSKFEHRAPWATDGGRGPQRVSVRIREREDSMNGVESLTDSVGELLDVDWYCVARDADGNVTMGEVSNGEYEITVRKVGGP